MGQNEVWSRACVVCARPDTMQGGAGTDGDGGGSASRGGIVNAWVERDRDRAEGAT